MSMRSVPRPAPECLRMRGLAATTTPGYRDQKVDPASTFARPKVLSEPAMAESLLKCPECWEAVRGCGRHFGECVKCGWRGPLIRLRCPHCSVESEYTDQPPRNIMQVCPGCSNLAYPKDGKWVMVSRWISRFLGFCDVLRGPEQASADWVLSATDLAPDWSSDSYEEGYHILTGEYDPEMDPESEVNRERRAEREALARELEEDRDAIAEYEESIDALYFCRHCHLSTAFHGCDPDVDEEVPARCHRCGRGFSSADRRARPR